MKKKGQIDFPIVSFLIIIIAILVLAPIMMKIFLTVRSSWSAQFGNVTGGQIAQTNFNYVMDTAITFWDKIIVIAYIINIFFLFISAFLIDTHPAFVVLYVLLCFFLILFVPSMIEILNRIYEHPDYLTSTNQLSFTNHIRTYFIYYLIGIMVFTGIIIYGKISLISAGQVRR